MNRVRVGAKDGPVRIAGIAFAKLRAMVATGLSVVFKSTLATSNHCLASRCVHLL